MIRIITIVIVFMGLLSCVRSIDYSRLIIGKWDTSPILDLSEIGSEYFEEEEYQFLVDIDLTFPINDTLEFLEELNKRKKEKSLQFLQEQEIEFLDNNTMLFTSKDLFEGTDSTITYKFDYNVKRNRIYTNSKVKNAYKWYEIKSYRNDTLWLETSNGDKIQLKKL